MPTPVYPPGPTVVFYLSVLLQARVTINIYWQIYHVYDNSKESQTTNKSKSSSLRAKARAVASRGRLLLIATRGCKILTRSSTMLATPKTSTMQIYKDHSLATCKLKLSQPGRPVCWSSGHTRDKHSTNRQIPQLGHLLAQAVFHKVLIATCILQTKNITGRPYL